MCVRADVYVCARRCARVRACVHVVCVSVPLVANRYYKVHITVKYSNLIQC